MSVFTEDLVRNLGNDNRDVVVAEGLSIKESGLLSKTLTVSLAICASSMEELHTHLEECLLALAKVVKYMQKSGRAGALKLVKEVDKNDRVIVEGKDSSPPVAKSNATRMELVVECNVADTAESIATALGGTMQTVAFQVPSQIEFNNLNEMERREVVTQFLPLLINLAPKATSLAVYSNSLRKRITGPERRPLPHRDLPASALKVCYGVSNGGGRRKSRSRSRSRSRSARRDVRDPGMGRSFGYYLPK